jgi:hypothetical protein
MILGLIFYMYRRLIIIAEIEAANVIQAFARSHFLKVESPAGIVSSRH